MATENMDTFKSLSRAQFVYEKIRDRIIDGTLRTNTSLTEEMLAVEFEVSRTPIREALRMLERDDLIELIPRKGAFIKGISITDIQETFTIREALEGISTRIAAEVLSENDLQELEKLLKQAREEYADGKIEESLHTGNELHRKIIEASNNSRILTIISNLKDNLNRLHHISAALPGRLQMANEEHFAILNALRERNGELSERKMRDHIIKTRDHLISRILR